MIFNSEEFSRFRESIKKAVAGVEKDFGVEIEFGKISYTQNDFTIKTTVYNGSVEENRKREFEERAELYGLKPDDFGREFIFDGKKTWIIGLETSRKKYPIFVKDETGKEFLITISGAKSCLEKVR